ncbi:MAG: carboxypeptidase M32 [Traorella sp.]
MNQQEALTFYKNYKDKCNAYQLANTTIYFDMSTIAPEDGNDYRVKMLTILNGEAFDWQTNPQNLQKIEEMATMDLGEVMNEEIRQELKSLHRISKLPKDFYMHMQEVLNRGENVWKKARKENDYALFKDTLKELVEVQKKAYCYYGVKGNIYDAMLDDFETGMNMEKYDAFFDCIKERLVPFIKKLTTQGKQIDDSKLHQHYNEEGQEKVAKILQDYMGFNPKKCYMGTTIHPFTCDFSLNDVRITTKYLLDSLASSIFSVIHEYGHALYMMNVNPQYEGLNVARAMTSGMHESQSRFLENYIGKRASYWFNNYPKIQEIFKDELKDVSLDEFVKMINLAQPSLIRTEADELTYPLHILIRYELEKQMINGEVDFDHLDKLWADKYEEYLGIRPNNVNEGILQDIHWAGGSFGYFPTYALGSAFSAQFFKAMQKDFDVDQALENNQFILVENWLKEHIHQYGALYPASKIIEMVCHEEFDPNVYCDYLIDKYTKLYEL